MQRSGTFPGPRFTGALAPGFHIGQPKETSGFNIRPSVCSTPSQLARGVTGSYADQGDQLPGIVIRQIAAPTLHESRDFSLPALDSHGPSSPRSDSLSRPDEHPPSDWGSIRRRCSASWRPGYWNVKRPERASYRYRGSQFRGRECFGRMMSSSKHRLYSERAALRLVSPTRQRGISRHSSLARRANKVSFFPAWSIKGLAWLRPHHHLERITGVARWASSGSR